MFLLQSFFDQTEKFAYYQYYYIIFIDDHVWCIIENKNEIIRKINFSLLKVFRKIYNFFIWKSFEKYIIFFILLIKVFRKIYNFFMIWFRDFRI